MYGITHAFLLRHRLAGQHCFIQPDFTLNYLTVYRNTIAGRQPQRHAELHLRFARAGARSVLRGNRHQGPLRVQKALYPEGEAVCPYCSRRFRFEGPLPKHHH